MGMSVVYARCAGLDVHKKTVVACLVLTAASGTATREVRTFATTTAGLLSLADWLRSQGVTHVAMESTGIYWRPVYSILESCCEIILVNAQHMKAVPGHKTDVTDSEWIADLLCHGLLKASFIPPKPIRDLRDLVRARTTLVQQRAQATLRVQKVLETANIKLSSVATDVLGVSGRAMLDAMLAGVTDAEVLAQLARTRLRAKLPALRDALDGRVEATHRLLLRQVLDLIDFLHGHIEQLSSDIEAQLSPYEAAADMSRFPSAKHLASWAAVAPGNKQSGGKRLRASTNHGNTHLRAVLAEVVWVISPTTDNSLSAQFHRLARRIGKKRAIVAVSHSLLVILSHLLRDKQDYQDLGPHFFQTLDTQRQRATAVRRLEALGYKVTLEETKQGGASSNRSRHSACLFPAQLPWASSMRLVSLHPSPLYFRRNLRCVGWHLHTTLSTWTLSIKMQVSCGITPGYYSRECLGEKEHCSHYDLFLPGASKSTTQECIERFST